MEQAILEIIKTVVVASVVGITKTWLDLRKLRNDVNIAFGKIRSIEAKVGVDDSVETLDH